MSNNKKKKSCIYNDKGYCYLSKSKYFLKRCNINCNYRTYYNSYKIDNNFDVIFLKIKGNLVLKIKIPIEYKKFREVAKNNIWTFQSTKKEKDITVQILLYNIESYIEFLFNGLNKDVFVKSSYLYIILQNVQEITNNKTPYNKMKKKIKINRLIKNKLGYLYLTISLDKDLVFSSIYKLFKNNDVDKKHTNENNFVKSRKEKQSKNIIISSDLQSKGQEIDKIQSVHVRAIVLCNNRKCFIEKHEVIDIIAIISIVQKDGSIHNISNPAVYCKECNQYIILKSDFKTIKQKGTLLCKVIDKTPEHITKYKKYSYSGTESRVHSLGYNVIKQGYDYTFKQRKIILANIIENYGVTQHEILSMLDANIARKINLPNYADAVEKWQEDREFVSNYNLGDCPEVVISEVVVGRR